jgi:hypothetical protein
MERDYSLEAYEAEEKNDSEQQNTNIANAYAALNCEYTGVSEVGLSFFKNR